ncbi:MAG TPA: hypothetical protein VN310_06495 [Candidatus Dormibacteraeota bacterium]|jgi:hypothetical protein|nr:hypothetical protein [Candidatus Dormibacteraeota bacterium]
MKFRIALTGFLLCFTLAHAQPTNLTCTYENTGRDEHALTFDESAGTAAFDFEQQAQAPAHATFTDTQITWEVNQENNSSRFWYTLSRTTGQLNQRARGRKSGNEGTFVWQCSVAQKKF